MVKESYRLTLFYYWGGGSKENFRVSDLLSLESHDFSCTFLCQEIITKEILTVLEKANLLKSNRLDHVDRFYIYQDSYASIKSGQFTIIGPDISIYWKVSLLTSSYAPLAHYLTHSNSLVREFFKDYVDEDLNNCEKVELQYIGQYENQLQFLNRATQEFLYYQNEKYEGFLKTDELYTAYIYQTKILKLFLPRFVQSKVFKQIDFERVEIETGKILNLSFDAKYFAYYAGDLVNIDWAEEQIVALIRRKNEKESI